MPADATVTENTENPPDELMAAFREAQDRLLMEGFGSTPPRLSLDSMATGLYRVAVANARAAMNVDVEADEQGEEKFQFYTAIDALFSDLYYVLTQATITPPEGVEFTVAEFDAEEATSE